MALHFEISEIKLVRKANGGVQHLSPGPHPLASFDLTTEELRCSQSLCAKCMVGAGEVE